MSSVVPGVSRRVLAATLVVLAAVALAVLCVSRGAGPARADTAAAPATGLPATFSSDPLPTVQTDGIVWANLTTGNTTYATGNFTYARPAGVAPSATHAGQTQVGGIVAFTTSTGVMLPATSFHTPSLNGPGYAIAVSPDGKTIYVGGGFTKVDGQPYSGVVAFNAATGALDPAFKAQVNGQVNAIVATKTAVYFGGSFLQVGTATRYRLAAVDAVSGALTSWSPIANGTVQSMVLAPDGSRLIVGGKFSWINSTWAFGSGSVDASTGRSLPWALSAYVRDYGSAAGIDNLSTDGKAIFGAGWSYATLTGGFEGRFAADPDTGRVIWVDDCHGDSYSTLPVGGVLYSTSHAYSCANINDFPADFPLGQSWSDAEHKTMAETTAAGSQVNGLDWHGGYYAYLQGLPASTVLDWFPKLINAQPTLAAAAAAAPGTVAVSGAGQAGWSLSSNGTYLVVGGEMTAAGDPGTASWLPGQQSLVRYAVHSVAPDRVGPTPSSVVAPTVTAGSPGTAGLAWSGAWDRDSENLTYSLYRDAATTPIYSATAPSTFWELPRFNFTDVGLGAGRHTYVLKVTDPDGNSVKVSASVSIALGATAPASPAPGADLALNRPTIASSLYGALYEPGNAVDGNLSDLAIAGAILQDNIKNVLRGIVHLSPDSWWQVDLGQSQPVSRVVVSGRVDAAFGQSAQYWVFTSNHPFDTRLTPAEQAAQPGVTAFHQVAAAYPSAAVTLPPGTTARYVLIQHDVTNYLTMREVQVYGPASAQH